MSEPIVFISNLRIKEGKIEEYKQFTREVTDWLKANRPRTLAILEYTSAEDVELSILIVFSDAEAMQVHMQGMGELPAKAFEYLELVNLQIYGQPTEATMETMKMMVGPGAVFDIKPKSLGGYIRFKAG